MSYIVGGEKRILTLFNWKVDSDTFEANNFLQYPSSDACETQESCP